MPRGIGDDELPTWRRKIAVGHVNGDALFPLGPQAIGQQSQIHVLIAPFLGKAFHRRELVLEDGFGVVEQTSNKSGFAVIDGAGSSEAEKIHREEVRGQKSAVRNQAGRLLARGEFFGVGDHGIEHAAYFVGE